MRACGCSSVVSGTDGVFRRDGHQQGSDAGPSWKWSVSGALCVALAGLAAAYFTLLRAPAAGTFHDDGIYLVTAKALAEERGYRILSVPGEPPQTKYPILFPWLVSLAWRINPSFPANLPWLRLVSLIATFAWLSLSWALLRRLDASRLETAAIVLLTATSPWVAFLSTTGMSETTFAALFTAALLMIVRMYQGDVPRLSPLAAGGLMGAASLTRIAGIAPALLGVLVLVATKRWRAAMQYAAGTAVVTFPWLWWVGRQPPPSADPYYSVANYASWNVVASYTWMDKLHVVTTNAVQLGVALVNTWQVPMTSATTPPLLVVALVVLIRGFWRERCGPVTLLMIMYCAVHLAWAWPPLRFFVPVVPLLLWFSYLGAGRSRRVGSIVALALFIAGGVQLSSLVAQTRETGVSSPFPASEDWAQTSRLLEWVSKETSDDAVLTGNLDPMYYLFTGRKAVRAFSADPVLLHYAAGQSDNPLGTLESFRNRLITIRADYLIMAPSGGFSELPYFNRLVSDLASTCEGALAPVATGSDPRYVVYRIDRRRLEGEDTCRARTSAR